MKTISRGNMRIANYYIITWMKRNNMYKVCETKLKSQIKDDPLWCKIRLWYRLKVVSGLNSLCLAFHSANKGSYLTMGLKRRQRGRV